MTIYLKDATFINWQTLEFKKSNIKINSGINGNIDFIDEIRTKPTDKVIDCKGKYVTKSFACGHHHVYSALSRGMHPPKKSPENFYEILKYVWWTLDKCLDEEMIEASALVTAVACAQNGVTFVIDHHASPFAIDGSLETIANAFNKIGVSHLLCYEISDRDGEDIAQKGLAETENYLKAEQGLVGLHASFTISDKTLESAVALAREYNSGIHVHTAEDKYDEEECLKNYHCRVIERLNNYGALDFSKTILGHCLHIDEHEKKIIQNSKAWVVQNSESNLNNNVGYFNSRGLGENIMLGTDGMHSDMLRSAKSAFYVGQGFDNIDYPGAYKRFRNVHRYLKSNNISGDGENNLVVLDYNTPTDFNQNNFYGHFLFGIESRQVQHVISNGELIVHDRKVINEPAGLYEFSKEMGKKLWDKMTKL
ncbi:MAG TPA: amidohydrolase family protein [Bacteroidales bacterium]|nr:amidohydrolase family protein [Bacteroidales bacterium]HPS17440.1 amidohydrolase family protein [Bacteroidales bacterium]